MKMTYVTAEYQMDAAHKAAHEVYDAVFAQHIKAGADYNEAQEAAQYASEIELDRRIDADWHRTA
jgi:hypothetical protein